MIVASGIALVLCAIEASSGQARFGPRLSYALPVAELCDLAQTGRIGLHEDRLAIVDHTPVGEPLTDSALTELEVPGVPLTVPQWVSWRGPRRIDPYLKAATDAGIVRIVDADHNGRKLLTVANAGPINEVTRRLITILDAPAPRFEDVAFVVLADAAGVARPHLRGWGQHKRRARLSALRRIPSEGDPAVILHTGLKTIAQLSGIASADPRTIDQQIGLTSAGRKAAIFDPGAL